MSISQVLSSYHTRFPLEQPEPAGEKNEDEIAIEQLTYLNRLHTFFETTQKAFYENALEISFFPLLMKVINLQSGSAIDDRSDMKRRYNIPLSSSSEDKFSSKLENHEFLGSFERVVRIENLALKIFTWAVGAYAMGRYLAVPSPYQKALAVVALFSGTKAFIDYIRPRELTLKEIKDVCNYRISLLHNSKREHNFVLKTYQAAVAVWTVAYASKFVKTFQPIASQIYPIAACVIVGKWCYDVAAVTGLFHRSVITQLKEQIAKESASLTMLREEYKVQEERRLVATWKKCFASSKAIEEFERLLAYKDIRSAQSADKKTGSGRSSSLNLTSTVIYNPIHLKFKVIVEQLYTQFMSSPESEQRLVTILTTTNKSN